MVGGTPAIRVSKSYHLNQARCVLEMIAEVAARNDDFELILAASELCAKRIGSAPARDVERSRWRTLGRKFGVKARCCTAARSGSAGHLQFGCPVGDH